MSRTGFVRVNPQQIFVRRQSFEHESAVWGRFYGVLAEIPADATVRYGKYWNAGYRFARGFIDHLALDAGLRGQYNADVRTFGSELFALPWTKIANRPY